MLRLLVLIFVELDKRDRACFVVDCDTKGCPQTHLVVFCALCYLHDHLIKHTIAFRGTVTGTFAIAFDDSAVFVFFAQLFQPSVL